MATASITNTFTNGTNADAVQVNANFTSLVNFLNGSVVHKDGSTSMTGQLNLVGNPVDDAHAARKAYVDAKFPIATASLTDAAVTTAKIADSGVTTAKVADAAVTAIKLAPAVAGSGLTHSTTTGLAVNVDASTLEVSTNTVRVKDGGVTNAKLANTTYSNIKGTAISDLCGRAVATSSQSIADSTNTAVTLAGEDYDYSGMHGTTAKVTVASAGVYHFAATVPWDASQTGFRRMRIVRYNSSNTVLGFVAEMTWDAGDSSASNWAGTCSGGALMAAGDYVQVEVYQTSGGALGISNGLGVAAYLSWHCVRLS